MSDEDDLLTALAEVSRDDPAQPDAALRDDDAWERLARSELTKEEEQALTEGLSPEEIAERRALYAPVDELVVARIARDAVQAVRPSAEPRGRRAVLLLGGLAAAAAVLLILWPRAETLPGYSIEVSAGAAQHRGDEHPRASFRPGDRLEIVLRPETEVNGEVAVVAFHQGEVWDQPFEVSPSGAVRLVGVAEDFFDRPGAHEITFVVGRPEELPATLEQADERFVMRAQLQFNP